MAIFDISVQLGHALAADFAANPNHLLLDGQVIYCKDGANQGKYKIGDGSTLLSALTFYGGISASGLTVGTTTITGGTSGRVMYNNAGVVGEYAISGTGSVLMTSTIGSTVQGYSASTTLLGNSTTGSGSNIVLGTSPTFVTDITTPKIYGSSASGGDLVLATTTNATKGTVNFIDAATNGVKIRMLVGSSTEPAIYMNVATPSATNYTVWKSGASIVFNCDTGGSHIYRVNNASKFYIQTNSLLLQDAYNIAFDTATGSKIGAATTQKFAFWNKTPIVQPTTGITGATLVSNGGTAITSTDTFGGYTLQQLAAIIINTGLAA